MTRAAAPSTLWIVPAVKTLAALLGFSAVVTEIATLVARHRFNAANFFSFFTVESNLLAVTSLLVSAYAFAVGRTGRGLSFFRGAVTLYMTTTILIFIVLLSGYPSSELTAVPWDNTVLHYIMPIVMILDWLLLPATPAVAPRTAIIWLAFPFAYLAYSLVRGPVAHWYPYPFMNPDTHGYIGVAITSVIIAVILVLITMALALLPRWRVLAPLQL